MTYFEKEFNRIKALIYSNEEQIQTVVNLRNYINNNYEKELNLDKLSRVQFVSKYHLLRLFKRYHGVTPRQYLIQKRIEKAKTFLKSGSSVSDTCYAVGFESIHSFSNLFKEKTGMSPSVFRRATFDKSKL